MAGNLPYLDSGRFDLSKKETIGNGVHSKVLSIPFDGERVAVKILHNTTVESDEVMILSKISHKNIVNFFGLARFDDKDCIVTELANRGSLAGILYNDKPPEFLNDDMCFTWTLNIAEGLTYLHNTLHPGISHGDLKSMNVLIFEVRQGADAGRRMIAKICDFGTGRRLERSTDIRQIGSVYWSAPEILDWESHSILSDVWSFGATAVEIFTRQKPYTHCEGEFNTNVKNIRDGKLTPMDGLSEDQLSKFPPVLLNILPKCFMCNRRERMNMLQVTACLSTAQRTTSTATETAEEARFHVYWWKENKELYIDLICPVRGSHLRSAIAQELNLPAPGTIKVQQRRVKRKVTGEVLLCIKGHAHVDEKGTAVLNEDVESHHDTVQIEDDDIVLTARNQRVIINAFESK